MHTTMKRILVQGTARRNIGSLNMFVYRKCSKNGFLARADLLFKAKAEKNFEDASCCRISCEETFNAPGNSDWSV